MMSLAAARRPRLQFAVLLTIALVVRMALAPFSAYLGDNFTDEGFWKNWMLAIHQHGLLNIFRSTDTDYVGYHYVLWLLSLVNDALGAGYGHHTEFLHLLVKAPAILFDLGLVAAVYGVSLSFFRGLRLRNSHALALGAAAVMALHPAVLYDSAVWSQTDSAVTLAMLLAVFFAVRRQPGLAFGIWAAGFLIKPHPIIILPILIYLAWRQRPRALAQGLVAVTAVWLIGLGPWLLHGDASNILRVYGDLFGEDQRRLSASAWNLWWFPDLALHPKPNEIAFAFLTYRLLGLMLSAAAGFLALLYLHARPNLRGALIASAYLAFAFYMLPISTHERYFYPFFAFMLPVVMIEKRWIPLYVATSFAFFFNLVVVAPPIMDFAGRWSSSPFTCGIAALNCLLFGAFTLSIVPIAVPSVRAFFQYSSHGARAVFRGLAEG